MIAISTIPIHVGAGDWGAVLPELIVAGTALILLLLDAFLLPRPAVAAATLGQGGGGRPASRLSGVNAIELMSYVALVGLALAFAASINLWSNGSASALYGQVTSDRYAVYFDGIILVSAALAILLSRNYIETSHFDAGEYYALLLASAVGMMLMAAGNSFMVLFIALELLSLALYILSGFERSRERSQEAGFKYFLLSSFASAFLIYGMALVYGATGSTQLQAINLCLRGATGCAATAGSSPLLFAGIGLMIVGFAFKVSIVPFHMWTPDVYQGAPTPVTAFMSVTTKAAVFAAFVRVFNFALSNVSDHWFYVIYALALVTMIVGNVLALAQSNMKRLLAYSGVAHGGYVLVALAANNPSGTAAVAFYFAAYLFMNIGAFIIVSVLESRGEVGDEIASYRGLLERNPTLAIGTAVFMFSLAGFPPTAGFFAKYLAFSAIVHSGHTSLAIVGVIASLVSVYYYLRVVYVMFFVPPDEKTTNVRVLSGWSDVAMAAAIAGSIGLGIFPTGFFNLATQGVASIRGVFGL